MSTGLEGWLYLLAFDHRESFQEGIFGIHGMPSAEQAARIGHSKEIALEGLRRATATGVPREHAGLLVDERYGAAVARKAKAEGFQLAMPVERSGQAEFEFEYGEDFAAHIEAFDPDFAKVLVRYNPDGQTDQPAPAEQTEAALGLASRAPTQLPLRTARPPRAGADGSGRWQP